MGQLCLGDFDDRMVPEKIFISSRIVDVAIGGEHTLLLDENGNVHGCGSNAIGQIGLGEGLDETSSPTMLDDLNSVSSISAGHRHSLFTADDGIYLTGSNEFGQLCTDTGGTDIYRPGSLGVDRATIISFEAISESSYILYDNGLVDGCGRNDFGQLGDNDNQDKFVTSVDLDDRAVRLLGVGPSAQSVFFVTTDERVWGTGLNDRGQLGVGDKENRYMPSRVQFGAGVLLDSVSAGRYHTLALGVSMDTAEPTPGSTVFVDPPSSGPTSFVDPTSPSPTANPTATQSLPTSSPSTYPPTLFATPDPTLNPTSYDNDMYYWGTPGSVGSSFEDAFSPVPSNKTVTDVSAGSKYSLIVLPDGTAQSAGFINSLDEYKGHLGLKGGDISAGENPFQTIENVFDESNDIIVKSPFFVKAYAGVEQLFSPGSIHSILIDEDGQAWASGSNNKGQLCMGDFQDRLIPVKIPIDGNITGVAIGSGHTLLLIEGGYVLGCGSNEVGQLGLGEGVDTFSNPTLVEGVGIVESLSAGLGFSLFKSDDGLYVAGNNFYGQLCILDNDVGDNVMTPYKLVNITSTAVITFEAIKTSSFIMFTDGTVGACGRNNFGQLGIGDNLDVKLPDRPRAGVAVIPNGLPIMKLGVGPSSESAFFIDSDGDVFATGLNDKGQLGVGGNENKNLLTKVNFDNGVKVELISASGDHALSG